MCYYEFFFFFSRHGVVLHLWNTVALLVWVFPWGLESIDFPNELLRLGVYRVDGLSP